MKALRRIVSSERGATKALVVSIVLAAVAELVAIGTVQEGFGSRIDVVGVDLVLLIAPAALLGIAVAALAVRRQARQANITIRRGEAFDDNPW